LALATTEPITGAAYLALSRAANGTTHVSLIGAILRRTLIEPAALAATLIMNHSEKAVACMADGYGRIAGRADVCLARSVSAATLANTPGIACNGCKPPSMRHQNGYREIPHRPIFSSVAKFSDFADVSCVVRPPAA
jgi:acetolactate synthase I/II/III large subunit